MKTIHIFRIIAAVVLSLSITAIQAQPGSHHHRNRHAPNHRYRDLPHWGYKYKGVPKGAFLLRHSGINYHYHSGIYYRPYGDTYVIARAPIGVRVRTLPNGTVHFVIGGRRYFYYYGTYYVRSVNDDYITVAPPVGAIVDALPDGYKKVNIDTYYEFEGAYYKAFIDENGEVLYEVVSSN